MVLLTRLLFSKGKGRAYLNKTFMDTLRINVKGGPGGMGLPKFGGIGGNGGEVIFEAKEDINLTDISKSLPHKTLRASKGANSHKQAIIGKPGDNAILPVPVGVIIYDQQGNKIGELNEPGKSITVAKGGHGGKPLTGFCGLKGESQTVKLDLKMIADIGLVGFPNAGKSSFLAAISQARPRIASYPFTTLQPQLGIAEYKDKRQISFADLPGLIEGAHVNIGRGHKFLKHVERTKLLILIVDIMGFQLNPQAEARSCIETIFLLNKELELYKESLLDKPALLLFNKCDLPNSKLLLDETLEYVKDLKEYRKKIPVAFRPDRLIKFDHIHVISALENTGIKKVLNVVREILDFYSEKDNEKEPVEQNNLNNNKTLYI